MTAEVFVSFDAVVPANICLSQQSYVYTWSVLTNQISNLVQSNYSFSLYLRTEAPNKLTCIHIETVRSLRRAVKLNM